MKRKSATMPPVSWMDIEVSPRVLISVLITFGLALVVLSLFGSDVFAGSHLPGEDASDKLEAAGTLLRLLDTGLFKWGARIFAGLCIMAAAWSLKEQRFGVCVICIVAAIIFGTAPTWVKNIFNMGGTDSVFSTRDVPDRYFQLRSKEMVVNV